MASLGVTMSMVSSRSNAQSSLSTMDDMLGRTVMAPADSFMYRCATEIPRPPKVVEAGVRMRNFAIGVLFFLDAASLLS